MKIRVASPCARAVEQLGDRLLVLEIVEQLADPLEIAGAAASIRLACPRTISTGRRRGILAPDRQPALDQSRLAASSATRPAAISRAIACAASASVRPASRAVM